MRHHYQSLTSSYRDSDRRIIDRPPQPAGPGKYCDEAVPARRNVAGELVIPKYEALESIKHQAAQIGCR